MCTVFFFFSRASRLETYPDARASLVVCLVSFDMEHINGARPVHSVKIVDAVGTHSGNVAADDGFVTGVRAVPPIGPVSGGHSSELPNAHLFPLCFPFVARRSFFVD